MTAKTIQREIEATVGTQLLKLAVKAGNRALQKSKLVQKKVYLPLSGIWMNYLERETSDEDTNEDTNRPTLLFFHGLSGRSQDYVHTIRAMKIPSGVRILCPDQIGHGMDLERAASNPSGFAMPTHTTMLESTIEFLETVRAGNNCNAFGISLGGGLAYYLRLKRPDIVRRTVLVSPAIRNCIDDDLLADIREGRKGFIEFRSRDDMKMAFRDLSTGQQRTNERKRKDPVPPFLLEALYRAHKSNTPTEGYHKELLQSLIAGARLMDPNAEKGNDDDDESLFFSAQTDVDRTSPRLVIWPEQDVICSYEKGRDYFKDSSSETEFRSIPDCGHCFHADGRFIMNIIHSEIQEYLLDFSSETTSTP